MSGDWKKVEHPGALTDLTITIGKCYMHDWTGADVWLVVGTWGSGWVFRRIYGCRHAIGKIISNDPWDWAEVVPCFA